MGLIFPIRVDATIPKNEIRIVDQFGHIQAVLVLPKTEETGPVKRCEKTWGAPATQCLLNAGHEPAPCEVEFEQHECFTRMAFPAKGAPHLICRDLLRRQPDGLLEEQQGRRTQLHHSKRHDAA